jgi:NAD(P)H-hydrate repair Nnr-like enzyme with NAD(P)H-hydrate epimerase domain
MTVAAMARDGRRMGVRVRVTVAAYECMSERACACARVSGGGLDGSGGDDGAEADDGRGMRVKVPVDAMAGVGGVRACTPAHAKVGKSKSGRCIRTRAHARTKMAVGSPVGMGGGTGR